MTDDMKPQTTSKIVIYSTIIATLAFLGTAVNSWVQWVQWNQYVNTTEAVSITYTSTLPTITVAPDKHKNSMLVTVSDRVRISNDSTTATSLSNVNCQFGILAQRDPPSGIVTTYDPQRGLFTPSDSCKVTELTTNRGNNLIGSTIYLGQRQSIEVAVVGMAILDKHIYDMYTEFMKSHSAYDDELFLLFIASNGEDMFGSKFKKPYSYLQVTRGRNLCKGYTLIFGANAKHNRLELYLDYYVGPIGNAVMCEKKKDKSIDITGSVPFKRDLFTGDDPFLEERRF